jgi:hypothetical protein
MPRGGGCVRSPNFVGKRAGVKIEFRWTSIAANVGFRTSRPARNPMRLGIDSAPLVSAPLDAAPLYIATIDS